MIQQAQSFSFRSMPLFGSLLPCMPKSRLWVLFLACAAFFTVSPVRGKGGSSEPLVLNSAVVVTGSSPSKRETNAVAVLVEEIEERTGIRLAIVAEWPDSPDVAAIGVGKKETVSSFADHVIKAASPLPKETPAESYSLRTLASEGTSPRILVIGADDRGVLYGVGKFLREMHLSEGSILLPAAVNLDTAPVIQLRGHQLGYRPKTNSYDAWSAEMWEQYIRDLAVFGINAVELIPPRSDDDADSPHFPLPQIEMMKRMSQTLDDYDLDVWIWYPAMDPDYSKPEVVELALKEWGDVFQQLPRIDAILVPAGDPGHTQPKYLLGLLEKETEVLKKSHPEAEMWVSAQSFDEEWLNEFLGILQNDQPEWLTGVVFGPQCRISLPDLRKALPAKYPIRRYPDITHTVYCQYPVPDWDVAHYLTINREPVNPRPIDQAHICRLWRDDSIGFITYSEGCNDDVNKIVWSSLGWNPDEDVLTILHEYSRYFISPRWEDGWAQGLLALERNWQGPLLTNTGVDTTLRQFQSMEAEATPSELQNWRFQQGLYRAYYDAYQRRRLIYETELQEQAMQVLRQGRETGSLKAIDQAEAILDRAINEKVGTDLRGRVFELAEALFQSIRMQLSVEKYQAIAVGRGANLDLIDVPLNDRNWLKLQFAEWRAMESDERRQNRIEEVLDWTNPGPGGFYDDLGDLAGQPHLVPGPGHVTDPEFRQSALIEGRYEPDRRISWSRHASSRYDAPLQMHYDQLNPKGRYKVKIVYGGDRFQNKVRLDADGEVEIHGFIEKPLPLKPLEFEVPIEATQDGNLTLTWRQEPGKGGNGRGCQVAEVWLIAQ